MIRSWKENEYILNASRIAQNSASVGIYDTYRFRENDQEVSPLLLRGTPLKPTRLGLPLAGHPHWI